jgi:hypothetical protein
MGKGAGWRNVWDTFVPPAVDADWAEPAGDDTVDGHAGIRKPGEGIVHHALLDLESFRRGAWAAGDGP